MWNRVTILTIRKLQSAYLGILQQAPRKPTQEHAQLTHRFLEYFQQSNPGNNSVSQTILHNAKGMRTMLELDKTLCNRASNMTNNEILHYLTVYMLNAPRRVTDFGFYTVSKSILAHRIEQLSAQEFVQFMYVVALQKKSYEATKYLKKCLIYLSNNLLLLKSFTLTDLLVLCNATFKTSTRIYNQDLLTLLQETLLNNLQLFEDPGMLTTLMKTLRHNECQNEELLATISAVIFFNQTYKSYTFTAISHILPLYADYLYYDENLFNLLTQCAIDQLKSSTVQEKNTYFVDNIRCKDIKRLLWCCTMVDHRLSHRSMQIIEEKIYDRVLRGLYDDEPETLLDSVYYMWMQEYQSEKLLNACKNKIAIIRGMQSKSKIRVNMLIVCMQIENSQLYKAFGHKADAFKPETKKELEKRPYLTKVHDILKSFMNDLDVNRLEFEYQVPHINILAITGYRKNVYKVFVVEVLDESNRIKNAEDKASGRMCLKMRLMYKMDLTVVVIDSAALEDMNEEDLRDHVRNEMSVVL